MLIKFVLLGGVAPATLVLAAPVLGQQAQRLPEIVADADRGPPLPVEAGEGVETGTATITREQIEIATPGSGDVNQLLKILPTVQFELNEGLADRESIQDLTPADISIAGGRWYENLFTVDGVDVSSRLDVMQDNPANFNEVAGATAQGLWLDSNLIGGLTLRDSNVSAEYGRFTGGALEIETRDPSPMIGASAYASFTSDALTRFKVSNRSRVELAEDGAFPERPEFEKWRYGATIDLPVSETLGTLFAVNRSTADVVYTRGTNYGSSTFGLHSVSENYLAKLTADLGGGTRATANASYSPYRSQSASANGVDNIITTHGGGLVGGLRLDHDGTVDWALAGNWSHNDTDREAPAFNYSIPSSTTNGNVCTATNCTIGGFGDLQQRQDSYNLKGSAGTNWGAVRISGGFDYQRTDVHKTRPDDGGAYQNGVTGANIVCADGDSLYCVTGEYALTRRQLYAAYEAEVGLDSIGGWAEVLADIASVTVRAGLRYDYEGYLQNHNFAPRVSLSWDTPLPGWSVQLGANRYYGRSLLGYALREQYPNNLTLERSPTLVNRQRVFSDTDWTIRSNSRSTSYAGMRDLKTPYSNELTAGLTGRLLGGQLQVRGILRDGEDEFSRAPGATRTVVLENGETDTYTEYTFANDGYSSYRGLSGSWVRSFGRHTVALNLNWSKSKSINADYDLVVADLLDGTLVLFDGEVTTVDEIFAQNQRPDFASPLLVNASVSSKWLGDRLTTNINLRYRDSFERIEDTGVNETVDSVRYDVFDWVHYPKALDVDLNAQAELIRSAAMGSVIADVRVSNLLDNTPAPNSAATAQPYQLGRSVWLGLRWEY